MEHVLFEVEVILREDSLEYETLAEIPRPMGLAWLMTSSTMDEVLSDMKELCSECAVVSLRCFSEYEARAEIPRPMTLAWATSSVLVDEVFLEPEELRFWLDIGVSFVWYEELGDGDFSVIDTRAEIPRPTSLGWQSGPEAKGCSSNTEGLG